MKTAKPHAVAKPIRMWIDGKSFRIIRDKHFKLADLKKATSGTEESSLENDFVINKLEDGNFLTAFRLPLFYYKQLQSFDNNFNVIELQNETCTKLSIPENEDNITVTGADKQNVINARNYIHWAVSQIRKAQRPKQFISIPTLGDEIINNFNTFKEKLLNEESIPGLEESVFQSSFKLHATLGVCALMDEREEAEAASVLNSCKQEIIDPILSQNGPLRIRLANLKCMQNNLKKVDVLYACMTPVNQKDENILQRIADEIYNYFYEKGLLIQADRNDSVKLHATLINTKYRKSPKGERYNAWRRKPIDARIIMEKYGAYHFGEIAFDSLKLSYMSGVGDDGYYKTFANVVI